MLADPTRLLTPIALISSSGATHYTSQAADAQSCSSAGAVGDEPLPA